MTPREGSEDSLAATPTTCAQAAKWAAKWKDDASAKSCKLLDGGFA